MSLDFKKRDYSTEAVNHGSTPPVAGKESALSMLLERSKGSSDEPPEASSTDQPPTSPSTAGTSPISLPGDRRNSATGSQAPPFPSVGPRYPPFPGATPANGSAGGATASRGPSRLNIPTDQTGSVRIPSSSYRRSSNVQSSLQQQRDRARTGDSSYTSTPTSSVLGTSAGYGPMFGAGEIGSVSSPRHYSVPISRDKFDPGSVDERFVVNIPKGNAGSFSGLGMLNGSSGNGTSSAASSISRSMSKVSLSRSSSRSSVSSLRRFIEKPWKQDDQSSFTGSPDSSAVSFSSPPRNGQTSPHSRKGSVASLASSEGEEDINGNGANGTHTYNRSGSLSGSDSTATLTQLDQQYASSYHRQNSLHQKMKKSLKAYGKIGKTLGEGAGGHVKIIRSNIDNKIYAVKEFRARHHTETLREYNKKVGAEYCLGLTLSHPNIVNTIDIIYETNKVYQVMEYAAYDLFALVMSGKMTRQEVYCDFRQLMEGVRYLHHSGLAHRDFKLDNCVVTDQGIVKIIDFGSSVVYRYPESDRIYDCDGVVGSDPYLAPEAAGRARYSPTPTDIWSSAIVLCCMLMRKFPWKAPRTSDPSFKTFISEETDGSRPGLHKLLSSLPEETHRLLTGMLDLDPESRFTIDQCWDEGFLGKDPHCTVINDQIIHASDHTHTSVSFEEAHIAMLEKKNRKAKKGEKMW